MVVDRAQMAKHGIEAFVGYVPESIDIVGRHASRRPSSERPRPRKRPDRVGRGQHARARELGRGLKLAIGESRGDPWRPCRGAPRPSRWRRLDRTPAPSPRRLEGGIPRRGSAPLRPFVS